MKQIKQFKALSIKVVACICLSSFINAQAQQVFEEDDSPIQTSYLESKDELKDYILDSGDSLDIEFINAPELSGVFTIDEQGEIYLKRIKYAYIRGLTIKELTQLLEERYKEFLIEPEIYIKIATYKPIRIFINGEIRSPGIKKFPAFTSGNIRKLISPLEANLLSSESDIYSSSKSNTLEPSTNKNINGDSSRFSIDTVKNSSEFITTLSNAIQGGNGFTSYSDISNIEIVRDIPIGKGGGKKRAIVNFRPFLYDADFSTDIRLFDGDSIFIPTLQQKDPTIIPNSILSGLSPKFIEVSISGQIENPGSVLIPIEGSLSDAMNLTGPKKPLAGKVYLVRYKQNGSLLRKNINYSATAVPGSRKNPYLISGDLITVQNSLLGKASGTIREITQPFIGVYAAKELIDKFGGN